MYFNKLLILKRLQQANAHLGYSAERGKAVSCLRASAPSDFKKKNASASLSYINGFRGKQPIIDLDKTVTSLRRACSVIRLIIQSNGHLLFVNTNPKYNKIIQHTAKYTNQSFINHKWIGGFLTNWNHMQNVEQQFRAAKEFSNACSIGIKPSPTQPFHSLLKKSSSFKEKNVNAGSFSSQFSKKKIYNRVDCPSQSFKVAEANVDVYGNWIQNSVERNINFVLHRIVPMVINSNPRYKKMQKCFEGLLPNRKKLMIDWTRQYANAPDCVIIFNANQNSTAIYEASLNQIPIISLVDSDIPNDLYNLITYPVPCNNDSVQFIYLFCNCILKTILSNRPNLKVSSML